MSQENVEIVRRMYEARDGGDAEGLLACFHPEVVLDARVRIDSGIVQGREEAGRIIGEWVGAFDDWREEIHEIRDLGSQVLVVATQRGHAKGSGIEVVSRYALLYKVEGGQITRLAMFDAEAEALAAAASQEAVSQENVETVRRAIAAINTRDIDAYLACCTENVELLLPMAGAEYLGANAIKRFFTDIEDTGPDFRIEVERVQAIGDSTVLALLRVGSTGRASGIVTSAHSANVYDFVDGKMRRIRIFLDRDEALKAVGLEG
jgi:ketosteroid isomerase-like protein